MRQKPTPKEKKKMIITLKGHQNHPLEREKAPAEVRRRKVHIRKKQRNLHPQITLTDKISPKMPGRNYP